MHCLNLSFFVLMEEGGISESPGWEGPFLHPWYYIYVQRGGGKKIAPAPRAIPPPHLREKRSIDMEHSYYITKHAEESDGQKIRKQ